MRELFGLEWISNVTIYTQMTFKMMFAFSSWMYYPSTHNHPTIGVMGRDVNGIVEVTCPNYDNGELVSP